MYKVGKGRKKSHRRVIWLIIILLLGLLGFVGYKIAKDMLKPDTHISTSKGVSSVVTYSSKIKHYDEPDFGIDLPATWLPVAREEGPYQLFTWQVSDRGTDGQKIQIFEDTIPPNFAVNRALSVVGEGDHLSLNGEASDNCSAYTKGQSSTPNSVAAPAKWMGVDFLCDQSNQVRNVVGTSSSDGINTVILRNPGTGQNHKFLFVYTSQSINPDYSAFYNALRSLKMQ